MFAVEIYSEARWVARLCSFFTAPNGHHNILFSTRKRRNNFKYELTSSVVVKRHHYISSPGHGPFYMILSDKSYLLHLRMKTELDCTAFGLALESVKRRVITLSQKLIDVGLNSMIPQLDPLVAKFSSRPSHIKALDIVMLVVGTKV